MRKKKGRRTANLAAKFLNSRPPKSRTLLDKIARWAYWRAH